MTRAGEKSPADFLKLFRSNPESIVLRTSVAKKRRSDGKLKAEYVTYERGPSERDVELHLAGKIALVAKPDLPDGTCVWGELDFDFYLDAKIKIDIINKISLLNLPLNPFESKSGGLHAAVFFKDPVPVATARALLETWKAQLGFAGNPNVDVFPKKVSDGKIPYGIALPFFGEPERFKTFEPIRHDLNGWQPPANAATSERRSETPATISTGQRNVTPRGDKIPRGSHDSELTRIAGKLRRDGLEEQAISTALVEICEKRCEDHGSDYKQMCAKIARSVCHYPVPEPHEKITDAGNADLLVEAERDNLLYCFEMKKWLCWDGKRWRVDDSQQARALIEKTMRARIAQVAATGTAKEVARASECLDSHRLTNGLREAEKKLGVSAADLDTQPFLITFENGTLDLETMQLLPHCRSHNITKMVRYKYDQGVVPSKFLSLLTHAIGANAILYLQKLLGYSMTGNTSEKTFIIVWGNPDTGKTTFLEIIRRLLEEYAALLQVDTLMEKRGGDSAVQEDLVSLRGARIATTSELDQNKKLSIAAIKRIVQGQGQITAAAKYEKKITFQESHKLWFDTNHLPVIPPDEQAVWNRVAIVVFSNPIPKDQQDKKLADTILRDEASAILAWMAKGEHMRQKEGLGEPPESFAAAKEEWRKNMDVIQQFIEECCESGLRESSNELYDAYVAWSGGANRAISHKVFTQRMTRLDHPLDGARRHYLGVSLASRSKTGGG